VRSRKATGEMLVAPSASLPVVVAMAAAIAFAATRFIAFINSAERFVADVRVAILQPAEPQHPDIVIAAITEETLERFPYRSPIDRRFLADLVRELEAKGARAIGIDVLFDQPTEPAKDDLLRSSLAAARVPIVVSYTNSASVVNERQRQFLDEFVPEQMRGASNIAQDPFDGTVRWIFPGLESPGSALGEVAGFPRALAAKLGRLTAPTPIEIAWHGRPAPEGRPFATYPAHLVPALPDAWFKDKIVLIGADLSIADRHRTPFAAVFEGRDGFLPGVVIQAHALAQLLDDRRPARAGWLVDLALTGIAAAVGAFIGLARRGLLLRIALATLLLTVLWVSAFVGFRLGGPIVALVSPTFAFALALWMLDAITGRQARRQKEFIQNAFSRYVSPKVVAELLKDPGRLSVDGERRVMTFLFTDIAGFTTLAELVSSSKLTRTLNTYLDNVCRIILRHDGTLDKFVGDAVFAIFNAPTDLPDHAERAVRCALEIDRFAEAFRRRCAEANIPLGRTRIGIHTGRATVGNFGSQLRMEYTAHGDAVNTAARLEGVNKLFDTRICVSQATVAHCRSIMFRPLGNVIVQGKSKAIKVFEPLDPDRPPSALNARYADAFSALERGDDAAKDLLAALLRDAPEDRCVAYHLERIARGARDAEIVLSEK
jgi:adenylate cyclase